MHKQDDLIKDFYRRIDEFVDAFVSDEISYYPANKKIIHDPVWGTPHIRPADLTVRTGNLQASAAARDYAPSMAGHASKLLTEGAWDRAATPLSKARLEDGGVYLVVSTGGLV